MSARICACASLTSAPAILNRVGCEVRRLTRSPKGNSIDLAAGLMKRTKPTEIEEFVHHRNLVYFCSFRH